MSSHAYSLYHIGTIERELTHVTDGWAIPVLEPARGGLAERFATAVGRNRHPIIVFFAAMFGGLALLAVLSIAAGFLLTHVLAHASGVGTANRHFERWLAAHRTPARTEASLIGSIVAGGVVLPIVVATIGVVCAALRKWRIAAFAVFGLIVESASYRATTLVVHEHRPRVVRLEDLQVNASYPSGHTAASIAVYGGLVLLVTSRITSPAFQAFAWTVAVAIPIFVGLARMYRGMHYPLDVAGGVLVGIAALAVIVFACRSAGAAAESRMTNERRAL
jgi:membrane-associated phospholipid phosphatase